MVQFKKLDFVTQSNIAHGLNEFQESFKDFFGNFNDNIITKNVNEFLIIFIKIYNHFITF